MEPLLQSKLHSILRVKTFINHSMNLTDANLRKMVTKSIRQEDDIALEDKQDAIEYFYKLLKKSR
jgi:DNA-binding transcriptional regulator WhiA